MRIHWTLVSFIGACCANLCQAQSQAYHLDAQALIGDKYAWSVASAGDTDADGQPDILVGSPFNDLAGTSAGAVFLYSGRTGALLHSWYGENPHDLFGWAVDGLGDADGDGFSDVVVGAPLTDAPNSNSGKVYFFSGRTGGLLLAKPGGQPGIQLGSVVRGLGDIDGDGLGDSAISAPYYDANGVDSGMFEVLCAGMPPMHITMRFGQNAGDLLGYSIENLIASGHEPSSRMLVGAPGAGSANRGELWVCDGFGGPVATLTGSSTDGWFGASAARIGDIDGDGVPEFAVGEPYADFNGTDSGRVVVCTAAGLVTHIFPGGTAGERFGETLAGLGDYNGDGVLDFLVGAPAADVGWTDAGRAAVLSANTGALLASWSGHSNDSLGRGLASAGDLNLDGVPDILIGAPSNSSGRGEAWAYLSRAPLPTTYCTPKVNSLGCTPAISSSGVASLSVADNFHVRAQTVLNNKTGLAIWSHGSATTPFNGAILCIQAPVFRTLGQQSGGSTSGSDCTGTYDFHLTQAYLLSKGVAPGNVLFAQVWSRDQGLAPPQNFGLTNALRFDVVP